MKWKRYRRKHPTPGQLEALQAREQADRQLESAHGRHEEALSITESLKQIRQRNHFGQSLENLNWSQR